MEDILKGRTDNQPKGVQENVSGPAKIINHIDEMKLVCFYRYFINSNIDNITDSEKHIMI